MKFNQYSFPHPVLGRGDDILGEAPSAEIIVDDDSEDAFVVTANYHLQNPDIAKMVYDGDAVFYCEVGCSGTAYREIVAGPETVKVFQIPKSNVRGKVEFLCLVVTTRPIPHYLNKFAHPELAGITTSLDAGDVVAYLGRTAFPSDVAFEKLKAASAFLEIVQGEKESGPFEVVVDNPKILVRLSKADYLNFTKPAIGQNSQLGSVFQSSVALPALTFALQQLVTGRGDGLEEKAWAKTILWRIDNEFSISGVFLESETSLQVAQLLLGSPIQRLLDDLSSPSRDEEIE